MKTIERLNWIKFNYKKIYRQYRLKNSYNQRDIAREYALKWANRFNFIAKIITIFVIKTKLDYFIINK